MTYEQKVREGIRFYEWLRKKYPVSDAKVEVKYLNKTLRSTGVTASIWITGCRSATIEIATKSRPIESIWESIGHEYRHVQQLFSDNIPIDKIKGIHEISACGFGIFVRNSYIEHLKQEAK